MDNAQLKYADPSAYTIWLKAGIAALAMGLFIAGLGQLFAPKHMAILGNFLRIPGGVLVTTGLAIAGLKADTLPDGVRMCALIASGALALFTC